VAKEGARVVASQVWCRAGSGRCVFPMATALYLGPCKPPSRGTALSLEVSTRTTGETGASGCLEELLVPLT
jgi:hypothetical protein